MEATKFSEVRCTYPYAENQSAPRPGEIHVLYNDQGIPEMVNFLCPCGCGRECPTHVISIEEKQAAQGPFNRSCWGFDPKALTITPSIQWLGGCKAHFTITNGIASFS